MNEDLIYTVTVIAGIILAFLGVGYIGYQTLAASGDVDFCYVVSVQTSGPVQYAHLIGHRSWREDKVIATSATFDDAVAAAEKVHCKLGTAP